MFLLILRVDNFNPYRHCQTSSSLLRPSERLNRRLGGKWRLAKAARFFESVYRQIQRNVMSYTTGGPADHDCA
jgi:hypothetical protein